jgi:hypothetical protein
MELITQTGLERTSACCRSSSLSIMGLEWVEAHSGEAAYAGPKGRDSGRSPVCRTATMSHRGGYNRINVTSWRLRLARAGQELMFV